LIAWQQRAFLPLLAFLVSKLGKKTGVYSMDSTALPVYHNHRIGRGGRQRLGAISKQGHRLLRTLLVEAAQTATGVEPNLRRYYRRLKARRSGAVAKVAIARKLAVRLFWMLRSQADYGQLIRRQGSPRANLVE
jgi:Transposase IS116/IS110/IS902 family